ncbi:general stress protein [Saccharothrix sp. HUAS TT1]|uniref:general stress protein n=1 Tax=unclassified Saccharothrix TaxID=2593673 RepID=UPI00345B5BED
MPTTPLLPREPAAVPTPPTGWPIGSYATYAEAQRAVDHLTEQDFPVPDVTIVGVNPMIVERVTARLTWRRVLAGGAVSGAWFGLFVGLLLGMFGTGSLPAAILTGLVTGVVFGMAFAAAGYASVRGRRDFASTTQLVAGRYDVLCEPRTAERGRDLLARLALASPANA